MNHSFAWSVALLLVDENDAPHNIAELVASAERVTPCDHAEATAAAHELAEVFAAFRERSGPLLRRLEAIARRQPGAAENMDIVDEARDVPVDQDEACA